VTKNQLYLRIGKAYDELQTWSMDGVWCAASQLCTVTSNPKAVVWHVEFR